MVEGLKFQFAAQELKEHLEKHATRFEKEAVEVDKLLYHGSINGVPIVNAKAESFRRKAKGIRYVANHLIDAYYILTADEVEQLGLLDGYRL